MLKTSLRLSASLGAEGVRFLIRFKRIRNGLHNLMKYNEIATPAINYGGFAMTPYYSGQYAPNYSQETGIRGQG
jgi:hypothetical protein